MADLGAIGINFSSMTTVCGGAISGVVLDADSNPTRHLVIAVSKRSLYVTGAFSDPATGEYTIHTGHIDGKTPHVVFEMTKDGSQNARIFDNVIPL